MLSLTVAVLTYRRPDMLDACLAALVEQISDTKNVEVLVVDNDPSASAGPIVERFARWSVRYTVEPRPGVSYARNRAVSESNGAYLAFIDDDETVLPGWLKAVERHISAGVAASFGKVIADLSEPVDPDLRGVCTSIYSRDLGRAQDADVTASWIHLGTGNSLFLKKACFETECPFSSRFAATGGEDVFLLQGLVAKGVCLMWNPSAGVREHVPAERTSLTALTKRRLRQGQQRVTLMRSTSGFKGLVQTLFWMGVGAAQALLNGISFVSRRSLRRGTWKPAYVEMFGGIGKLWWWTLWKSSAYAGATVSAATGGRTREQSHD